MTSEQTSKFATQLELHEMTAEGLKAHLEANVKTFTDCQILAEGSAYHYTSHFEKIEANGGFLGAPIDENLDRTQETIPSKPAEHHPGVVFAYDDIEEAKLEGGKKCDIIEIMFTTAVEATHEQEAAFGDAPPSIMILTRSYLKNNV